MTPANKLLGRKIVPQPGLFHVWPLKPDVERGKHPMEITDLLYAEATIIAVWVEKGNTGSTLKVGTEGPGGETHDFYLSHVLLKGE